LLNSGARHLVTGAAILFGLKSVAIDGIDGRATGVLPAYGWDVRWFDGERLPCSSAFLLA
jgi:hypothetical protein